MQEFINLQGGHIEINPNDDQDATKKKNKKMTMDKINSQVLNFD